MLAPSNFLPAPAGRLEHLRGRGVQTAAGRRVRTVVLVNDAATVRGGADRIVVDSALGFAARGYDVIVFAAIGPVAAELTANDKIKVVCLEAPGLLADPNRIAAFIRGVWNRTAAQALGRILAKLDPLDTIVHVHLYMGALSPAVPYAACRLGFRTVLSLHDYFLTCPNGAYFIYPRATICPHRPMSAACLGTHCDSRTRLHKPWRITREFVQAKIERLARSLSAVIAVSEISREVIGRHLPDGTRIEVIPNIVNLPQPTRAEVAFNSSYVFSGRLENYKGPHLLTQAGEDTGLPVVICGSGPMETELRRKFTRARFTGWLQRTELDRELRAARAFVFPSIVPETFGLSAAEALAHGVPVIASRGTAAREFVQDGINGLLFEPGSTTDLADKMRQLANPEVAARLSEQAYRNYWANPFSLQRHLNLLEDLYAELI